MRWWKNCNRSARDKSGCKRERVKDRFVGARYLRTHCVLSHTNSRDAAQVRTKKNGRNLGDRFHVYTRKANRGFTDLLPVALNENVPVALSLPARRHPRGSAARRDFPMS